MKLIQNLSLRSKLWFLLFLLLLPLSYFTAKSLFSEWENAEILEVQYQKLQETGKYAQLLNYVQKERALSYGYLFTSSKDFKNSLSKQRILTDKAYAELAARSEAGLDQTIPANFSRLSRTRQEIDNATIDSLDFEIFFGDFISGLAEKLNVNNAAINDPIIQNQIGAYINLLEIKYYLSQLRTLVSKSIFTGRVSSNQLIAISGRNTLLKEAQQDFVSKAPAEIFNLYHERMTSETVQRVEEFIQDKLLTREATIIDENQLYWYETFTAYIDALHEIDDPLFSGLTEQLLAERDLANQKLLVYLFVVLLFFTLSVALSFYIINSLLTTVGRLKAVAEKVALGETAVVVPETSRDEIGSFARSFKSVVDKNNHLAEVAEEIGKGNYEIPVQVSSDRDLLSNALLKMKINLKMLSEREKVDNWILSGVEKLGDTMQGDRALRSVCNKIISHTCDYVNAELGALYLVSETEKLVFVAGYAYTPETDFHEFDVSDNLVGQALRQRKIITLEDSKNSDLKVKTGFYETDAVTLLLMPLFIGDTAVGVIELASRHKFTDEKIAYLEKITEKIAIAIATLQADEKTSELLAETQSQAEELETQQEELRQMNIELISQKNKLQQSEEELRTNQEELEEKNDELEQKARLLEENYEAINSKNKALENARYAIQSQYDELQRVGKYRSDFLANMSHELRTPLNSILILADLIAANREHNLTPKQIEFAQIIHNSGNDLLKLINEILDLTKIESGKLSLEVAPFEIKGLDPAPLFGELAKEKNIKLEVNFHDDLPETMVSDHFRIEQILKNLLSNAFKFTEEGGIVSLDVFVPDINPAYNLRSLKEASRVIAFAVCDTGMGISEEEQKVIFDAFRQADSSTTRKFGGTGLGLSISKQLAHLLGGEIHLESELKRGSCFTLYIPEKLTSDEEVAPKDLPQKATNVNTKMENVFDVVDEVGDNTKQSQKVIVIIEDDKAFSKILSDFALARGIRPMQAYTGKDGLKLIKELSPDAILLDIHLPDISGWEILDKLKQKASLKNIPVHIMSAYEDEPGQQRLKPESYLAKPVSLESLDKAFNDISRKNNSEVKRILVVEDDAVQAHAIKELLLAHNIESVLAGDSSEAFEKLKDEKFDCLILDINLPGMGGNEFLEKLKRESTFRTLPVIVYSGKDFSEEEEIKLKKHVNAIVIKTEYSYKRLMDEVKLFLHKVQEKITGTDNSKLYLSDESLKGKKALIVDDDSRNIYSLYNAFEAEGLEVIVANNGIEALDKLKENPDIDVVLMDVMMPVMDGLECTRKIRAQEKYANLPIIAVTAKAMKEDKEKCLEAGASDYVTKPVNVDKLVSLMRVWIYKSENIRFY